MPYAKPRSDLSENLIAELANVQSYISVRQVADRIWNGVLSPEEKVGLEEGGRSGQLIDHVARLRNCSFERALVDIAADASIIDGGRRTRLLNQLGENPAYANQRPHWDPSLGQLTFHGEIIGSFTLGATNVRLILQALEDAGWKVHVDNPLPGGPNSKKLRDAINYANKHIKQIRLSSDGQAKGVRWNEITPARTRRLPK